VRERTNGNLTGAFLPVAIFLVLLTIFRLWTMAHIELNSDEAYYWLWSRVPSAGYYDHPPMIAWFLKLFSFAFGKKVAGPPNRLVDRTKHDIVGH
jgi:4-amino-4-deoxy-L-arabinose transferase-like glycosyltransferase